MRKVLTLLATATLGLGLAAQEADAGWFDDFDDNTDRYVDTTEFETGVFEMWDANDDLGIDQDEFNTGTSLLYDGNYDQSFGNFDANGNGTIDSEEFLSTYGTGLFDTWESDDDSDDILSDDEFGRGVFGVIDDNGDGTISQSEFDANTGLFAEDVGFSDLDTDGNGNISTEEFVQNI